MEGFGLFGQGSSLWLVLVRLIRIGDPTIKLRSPKEDCWYLPSLPRLVTRSLPGGGLA